ncbi:MAG: peptide ABC transporter substrate-binding protein [Phycisphaerae bacterium]
MLRIVVPIFLAGSALLLGFLALGAATPRADFTYVNPSGIHTLDPARMSWTTDFRVALNLWEGLTTWDPETLDPVGAAAVYPPEVTDAGATYRFKIRRDARWSNGDSVTADDFVRGWRRGMEPGTSTDYAFLFADHIVGAEAYMRWRTDVAAALTALARLRQGWAIEGEAARGLLTRPIHPRIEALAVEVGVPTLDEPNAAWGKVARRLSAVGVDYDALYDAVWDTCVAEFDRRFADVGVEATAPDRLQVRLVRPTAYFLDLTGFPVFLPCHKSIERFRLRFRGGPMTEQGLVVYDPQWTKPGSGDQDVGLITNGPYRLTMWAFKRRARLEVNPHHRNAGRVSCRTVDMVVYENLSAALMAYEAGDVDFLPDLSVPYEHELVRLAQSGARSDFHLAEVIATYFFNFNCVSSTVAGVDNPFVDPRIRRAFTLAVDREQLVYDVLNCGDRVARTFVPPGTMQGYPSPRGLGYDVAAARRLLSECGFADGQGFPTVELLYPPREESICQAVAGMWATGLGVRVALRSMEGKAFAEQKANFHYMVARGNWYADYLDPTTFLDCLASGNGNNDSGYSNARYDRLLRRARDTSDASARAALLAEAERLVVEEDCPILPVLHDVTPIAFGRRVSGLHANARLWFPFQNVAVAR